MKTLLKIAFCAALGVAACFAWEFYQAEEMAKKGLKRGWVPKNGPEIITAPAKPAPPPQPPPAAPKPAPAKKPEPPPTPAVAAAPVIKPEVYRRLAAEWWRWPQTVKVREERKIRFDPPEGGSVIFTIAAGATVRLHQMTSTGTQIFVFAKGSPFNFPIRLYASDTDLLATAKPEGTPKPPPPVRPAPAPARNTSSTASSGGGSRGKPSNSAAHDGPNLPPPPQHNAPAPTLFGVPIQ